MKLTLISTYRPLLGESIEQRHAEVKAAFQRIDPPLGWRGRSVPELEYGSQLEAFLTFEYPKRGTCCIGQYENREAAQKRDTKAYDDKLHIKFYEPDPDIDYRVCRAIEYSAQRVGACSPLFSNWNQIRSGRSAPSSLFDRQRHDIGAEHAGAD
jgi:hypothetical protein